MNSGWNLPPGCFERDLPGNRPEDEAFEAFMDTGAFGAVAGSGEEAIELAFLQWLRDVTAENLDE